MDESETSAAVTPVTRFAPVELLTARRHAVCRILPTIRVVVVLPLVPVIAADPRARRRDSFVSTLRSTRLATTPGTVEPPPRRSVRLASRAARAATMAAERRTLSRIGLMIRNYSRWHEAIRR